MMKKEKKIIARFVLSQFDTNPDISTQELVNRVKKYVPTSKFSPTHVAWYKFQIRHGIYAKRVKSETFKKLQLT